MVISLGRGGDLHIAQLMPLPLTVSCFRKIQIGCTFLVPAYRDSPEDRKMVVAVVVMVVVEVVVLDVGSAPSMPLLHQECNINHLKQHMAEKWHNFCLDIMNQAV